MSETKKTRKPRVKSKLAEEIARESEAPVTETPVEVTPVQETPVEPTGEAPQQSAAARNPWGHLIGSRADHCDRCLIEAEGALTTKTLSDRAQKRADRTFGAVGGHVAHLQALKLVQKSEGGWVVTTFGRELWNAGAQTSVKALKALSSETK